MIGLIINLHRTVPAYCCPRHTTTSG